MLRAPGGAGARHRAAAKLNFGMVDAHSNGLCGHRSQAGTSFRHTPQRLPPTTVPMILSPEDGNQEAFAMIDRKGPGHPYVAKCDGCSIEIRTGQTSFQQAVNYISRAEGWRNERPRGVWANYCPRCAEAADDIDIVGIGFSKRPYEE
jgi:hypothetical protein